MQRCCGFFILYNNNYNSLLEFQQTSAGIPLVLVGHFQWTMGVGLLLFHRKSIRKVRWTLCLTKKAWTSTGKSSEKYCGEKAKKYVFCLPSVRQSLLGVHPEKQWECKDLDWSFTVHATNSD